MSISDRSQRLIPLFGAIVVLIVTFSNACNRVSPPETDKFQQAETCLRRGDYDEAIRLYHEFLHDEPNSPFAHVAQERLLNIDRELESVMGRRPAPAPLYIRPVEPESDESGPSNRENRWDNSVH